MKSVIIQNMQYSFEYLRDAESLSAYHSPQTMTCHRPSRSGLHLPVREERAT